MVDSHKYLISKCNKNRKKVRIKMNERMQDQTREWRCVKLVNMYRHRKTRWSNNSCCEIRERNDKNVRKKTRHQKSGREVKRNSRARKPRKGLISKGCKGCSSIGVPGRRNRMQYHPKKKEEKGRNSVARNPDANRAYEVVNPLQIRNVSSARWMGVMHGPKNAHKGDSLIF